MFSVNNYLDKEYKWGTYQCANFAADVWEDATGESIRGLVQDACEQQSLRILQQYRKIALPYEPCIAMMKSNHDLHMGVFVDGRILHLTRTGARHDDVHFLKDSYKITYYR